MKWCLRLFLGIQKWVFLAFPQKGRGGGRPLLTLPCSAGSQPSQPES